MPATEVALALNEQDLFWRFHDLAFANQNDVSNLAKMKSLAESLGADMEKLDQSLSTNKYKIQAQSDNNMGIANGVTGTPTFFVNGRILEGAQSYSAFKQIIDLEISKYS